MQIPKLFTNTTIYSVVMVLQKGISFFLLPIYTMFLQPSDYGVLGVASSLSSFLSIFITLSLGAASTRFYYSHNKDENYARKLYGTIVSIVFLNSLFFGAIFVCCHKWIIDPFLGSIDFFPCIFLGMVNVIVTPLYLYFQEYLQTRQEGLHFGINSMCFFVLQVGLTVISLSVLDMGVVGVLSAQLVTSVVFFIYAACVFARKIEIGVDKQIAKESIRYALPLVPHALANWSNGTIDKLLINGLKSEATAGLYNLGQQFASTMNIFANAINQAYVPWFFDQLNDKKRGIIKIQEVSEMIVCMMSLVALLLSLFSKEILDLMIKNPAYDGVWKIIPLLVAAYLFHGLYFFFVNILFVSDTKVVFTVTVATIAVNVGANILLIPGYGYVGSAVAFLITYLFQSLLAFIVSYVRNKEIRLRPLRLFGLCVASFTLSISCWWINDMAIVYSLLVKILLVIVISLIVYYRYHLIINNIITQYAKHPKT